MEILVIEDNSDLASGIETSLSLEGYICEFTQTVDDAMDKIQLFEYDCILLDISLPDGSGFTIFEMIKQLNKQAGVIIISAKDSLPDKIKGPGPWRRRLPD